MTDRSFDAAIDFAAELIRIPSPSGHEEEVARRVVQELEALGFDDAWIDGLGNAIGVIRGEGRAAPVMLSSHLDVVDAGHESEWEHPPYGGEVVGGYLHGRGAMDIKGPLALQTYAAASFVADRPAGDVVVAHTVFEERGGWGMDFFLSDSGIRPGVVVIGESTGGDICVGHRGRAEVLVELRGEAGHASAPDRARNALDGVGPVLDAVADFARSGLTERDPVLGRSTVAATDVRAEPDSRNVIPDRAVIVLDWRVLPGRGPDEVLETLRAHLAERLRLPDGLSWAVRYSTEEQETWTGRTATRTLFGGGFLLEVEHPVVPAAVGAVEAATGERPHVRPWAFATDGRHTHGEHGIPTLGYAPGEERHAHTNRERLELGAAERAYRAYPMLIRALLETVPAAEGE